MFVTRSSSRFVPGFLIFMFTLAQVVPVHADIDSMSFGAKVDFSAGSYQLGIAIGDLDGDGKPELVSPSYTGSTVSVLRNTSTSGTINASSFSAGVSFSTGSFPYGVAVADLDGDGKPDLAVTSSGSNAVSVFRNTSTSGVIDTSSFATKVDFSTGSSPYGIAIGDLDGDGKLDLAVANINSSTISVLRNTSTTGTIDALSFAPKVDFSIGFLSGTRSIEIGDLDGDGKPELIVANSNTSTVSIFRNTTMTGTIDASSFATKVDFGTGANAFSVVSGDLDGDSKPDLAVANYYENTVSVLRNTSVSGVIDGSSFAPKVDFGVVSNPRGVVIGDLDGDNKPDLVVANTGSNVASVLRNITTIGTIDSSSFVTKVDFNAGSGPLLVAIGDLDGEGKPEIVTVNSGNTISVLRNTTTLPSIDQTITITTGAPTTAIDGLSFTLAATASSGLPVSYSSSGSCTNVGADFTMTSGVGTCTVMYDQVGDANYNAALQVIEVVTAQPAMLDQIITVIRNAPINGYAGDEFRVEADASSGLLVTYSAYGDCTNVNEIFTITENDSAVDDICYVRFSQDGDSTYNPALPVTQEVIYLNSAPVIDEGDAITVTMSQDGTPIAFVLRLNALDKDLDLLNWSISSPASYGAATIPVKSKCDSKKPKNPNDPKLFCRDIGYTPKLGYSGTDSFEVRVDDGNLADTITVNVIIEQTMLDQTITVTTNAPTSAVIGDNFTVAATASSGFPITYTSSGACTNVDAEFTMTSSSGICIVSYDQVGDSTYNPAPQVIENVTALSNVPDLLSPVNAEQLLNNQPTFDWSDVSGAITYTIQISNNAGFTGSPTSITVTDSTYTQPTNLPNNVTRYWRVQANRAGGPAPWSEIRSFVTAHPPSTPGLVSPGNNSLTTDYTPLLNWNDSNIPAGTTFDRYELQIATDSDFASPTTVEVSSSEYTSITDLDSNTTYYWRVRAYNILGQYSAWSNVRNFRTALLPPTLITPIEAEQMLVNRPTFEWDDVAGATGYRIQISNNIDFTSTLTNVNVTSSTYTRTSALPFGTTLYWRVRSNGTNGPSSWSEVRSLTTTNPPSVPILASPGNNAKVSGPSPLFDWNDSTLPVGIDFDYYQIQVASDNTFTTIVHDNNVTGINNSQDNTAVLLPATTYYWRVRSFNTVGHASAWSNVRSIRIKFASPTLNLPGTGITVDSLLPTFIWDAVSGATSYTIQVSKNNTFSPLVINTTTTSPTYTHTANLQAGTTYYWRVRVRAPNTYGPGDWSETFTFTTP